jgi:alpha-glucoside transport system permease protein
VADGAVLEQLLPDGRADLDPDRVRHGDPVGRARGIPEETVEAAIVDGANPFQIFFKIKIPQIAGTIVVVWTTITIVVLKVFDIVFAMTNGQWETQVLANYMYDKLFRANDWGVGSASAMIIMLMVTPILVWNVYNARKEMR